MQRRTYGAVLSLALAIILLQALLPEVAHNFIELTAILLQAAAVTLETKVLKHHRKQRRAWLHR